MATRRGVSIAIVFGVFFVGLIAVAFLPALFTAANQPADTFATFNESDTVTVTDGLTVELIDASNEVATVEVFDRPGSERVNQTVSEGDVIEYTLPTGNVSVDAVYVDNGTAELRVSYPRDFGFSDSQQMLAGVIPMLGVILTLFIYLAFIVGVALYD